MSLLLARLVTRHTCAHLTNDTPDFFGMFLSFSANRAVIIFDRHGELVDEINLPGYVQHYVNFYISNN